MGGPVPVSRAGPFLKSEYTRVEYIEILFQQTGSLDRGGANGVKFERKRKPSDYQRQKALKRRVAGETLAEIAKSHGLPQPNSTERSRH